MGIGKTGKEQTQFEMLESYKYFKNDRDAAEYNVKLWSEKLDSMAGTKTDTQMFSGGLLPADRVGEYVERWQEVVDFFLERMRIATEKMMLCEAICDELPPKHKTIMRRRYIDGISIKTLAKELDYSIDRMKHLIAEGKEIINIALNSTLA